ncbi:sensor histidine kinase [Microbacteriaceae bacterium 4G12]
MLNATRLFMLVLISFIYYLNVPDEAIFLKIFIGVAIVIYILTHILIMSPTYGDKWFFVLLFIDCVIITAFGLLFPTSSLYLILFGIEAVTLFLHTDNRKSILFFVSLFFVSWISILLHTYIKLGVINIWDNLINFMFIVFEVLVGGLIHNLTKARALVDEQYKELQESHHALQAAHEQLRMYAKEVEELTVIRERNHIAREIHDTVGHNMTALLVQLQLAQELFPSHPERAKDTLQTCYALAQNSLQEIRLSVRTLKEDTESYAIVPVLRTILRDFSQTTNVETSFQLQGDPAIIPTSLHSPIARMIQESLTNAKRHGDAKRCHVELICHAENIIVSIEDDGKGAYQVVPGFGLINMKERVEEHGGMIFFEGKKDTGFQVKAQFPLQHKRWTIGGSA